MGPLMGAVVPPARKLRIEIVVSLIAATTTRTGLRVQAAIDTHHYATAIRVSDEELAHLQITPHAFHGDWNYTIVPRDL